MHLSAVFTPIFATNAFQAQVQIQWLERSSGSALHDGGAEQAVQTLDPRD
jgi:hypothetical protein